MNEQTFMLTRTSRGPQIERVCKVLSKLSLERTWVVSLREYHKRRSTQQNAYLWGIVYPAILKAGGETLRGWTADEIHEYCLGEFSGWEIVEGFGVRRRRPLKRSARMTTAEFTSYIEFIQHRMAEHGIYVPSPNEDMP